MKKLMLIAVILTAFVFESNAYYEGIGGYFPAPNFYREKTVSSIWQSAINYRIGAHGNTSYPNMFAFARIAMYSSPYYKDVIFSASVYSYQDSWVEKSGLITAPSGLYIYKVFMAISGEVFWTYNPTNKHCSNGEAAIWW